MKLLMVSLGCDKNLCDTEAMLGLMLKHGFEFTDDEEQADVIVINTCAFIGDAKEESINTILQMARHKTENGGRCRALVCTGCLAQRYHDEMREELPEVDAIVGTTAIDKVVDAINAVLAGKNESYLESVDRLALIDESRIVTTGGHYAYLKIAEGCDKHCSYCIIPKLRGSYRSVPMERLIKEAIDLTHKGVRELILVAQETTLYGVDIYGRKMLPGLLKELCRIEDLKWIRLLYCYPEEITDELINTIRDEDKICNYIDMPIQHASDAILKRMGRKTSRGEITALIAKIRDEIPDICLRTSLISGFPGETDDDFDILMNFVSEMKFDRLGVFTYSPEEGTAAAEYEGQINEGFKELRRDHIMELQQDICFKKAGSMTGKTMTAFIEGKISGEDAYAARTYMDAPGVDGLIFINTDRELMSGDLVKVRVTGSYEYDLTGELCDEDEPA